MGRLSRIIVAVLALAAVGACEDGEEPEASIVPPDFLDSYPQVRDCRFSIDHDSEYITVYADPDAAMQYTDGVYPFAEGTVLVKPLHRDPSCTQIEGYVAMKRLATGAAPDDGDWQWQELDTDLNVIDTDVPRCVMCHQTTCPLRDLACTDP